jgi:xanthine dehydrogenase accessory factor
MFAEYRKQGVSEKMLEKVHAPIGYSIRSQTPEEIAVSIAAEIIQIKNQ